MYNCFVHECWYMYWDSDLHALYTSLLGTEDAQRDYLFITCMSELPFLFR